MASMSEMVNAAFAIEEANRRGSRSGRVGSFLESAIKGAGQGFDAARQRKEGRLGQELDIQLKQAELGLKQAMTQKKIADMAEDADRRRSILAIEQKYGLRPPNEEESAAARETALEMISLDTPERDQSGPGRLGRIFAGLDDHEESVKWDPMRGLSVEYRKNRQREDRDPTIENERIRKAAADSARREKHARNVRMYGPEMAERYANVQPSPDDEEKFLPEVAALLRGQDASEFKATRRRQQALKDLETFAPQLDEAMTAARKGFFPTSAKKTAQADVERLRNWFKGDEFGDLEEFLSKALLKAKAEGRFDVMRNIAERLQKLREIRGI